MKMMKLLVAVTVTMGLAGCSVTPDELRAETTAASVILYYSLDGAEGALAREVLGMTGECKKLRSQVEDISGVKTWVRDLRGKTNIPLALKFCDEMNQ